MIIVFIVAIISTFVGVSLASYGQRVEAKYADQESMDEWNEFVKTLGGRK